MVGRVKHIVDEIAHMLGVFEKLLDLPYPFPVVNVAVVSSLYSDVVAAGGLVLINANALCCKSNLEQTLYMRGRVAYALAESWTVALVYADPHEDAWAPRGLANKLALAYVEKALGHNEASFRLLSSAASVCRHWDLATQSGPPTQPEMDEKTKKRRRVHEYNKAVLWGSASCFDTYIDTEAVDPHIGSHFPISSSLFSSMLSPFFVPYPTLSVVSSSSSSLPADATTIDFAMNYSILDTFMTFASTLQTKLIPSEARPAFQARLAHSYVTPFSSTLPSASFVVRSGSLIDPAVIYPAAGSYSIEQAIAAAGGHAADVSSTRGWGLKAAVVVGMLSDAVGPAAAQAIWRRVLTDHAPGCSGTTVDDASERKALRARVLFTIVAEITKDKKRFDRFGHQWVFADAIPLGFLIYDWFSKEAAIGLEVAQLQAFTGPSPASGTTKTRAVPPVAAALAAAGANRQTDTYRLGAGLAEAEAPLQSQIVDAAALRFTGSLDLFVNELQREAVHHTVLLDNEAVEAQVECTSRNPKKKRGVGADDESTAFVDIVQRECAFPIRYLRADPTHAWIRPFVVMSPEVLTHVLQLLHDKTVSGQLEAIAALKRQRKLGPFVSSSLPVNYAPDSVDNMRIITRALRDAVTDDALFWRVRAAAAGALVDVRVQHHCYDIPLHLYLNRRYCYCHFACIATAFYTFAPIPVSHCVLTFFILSSHFFFSSYQLTSLFHHQMNKEIEFLASFVTRPMSASPPELLLIKSIANSISKARDPHSNETPEYVVDALLHVLKTPPRLLGGINIDLSFFRAGILDALGNVYLLDSPALRQVFSAILAELDRDIVLPSYQQVVTASALTALTTLQTPNSTLSVIPLPLRSYTAPRFPVRVRLAAFQCMVHVYLMSSNREWLSMLPPAYRDRAGVTKPTVERWGVYRRRWLVEARNAYRAVLGTEDASSSSSSTLPSSSPAAITAAGSTITTAAGGAAWATASSTRGVCKLPLAASKPTPVSSSASSSSTLSTFDEVARRVCTVRNAVRSASRTHAICEGAVEDPNYTSCIEDPVLHLPKMYDIASGANIAMTAAAAAAAAASSDSSSVSSSSSSSSALSASFNDALLDDFISRQETTLPRTLGAFGRDYLLSSFPTAWSALNRDVRGAVSAEAAAAADEFSRLYAPTDTPRAGSDLKMMKSSSASPTDADDQNAFVTSPLSSNIEDSSSSSTSAPVAASSASGSVSTSTATSAAVAAAAAASSSADAGDDGEGPAGGATGASQPSASARASLLASIASADLPTCMFDELVETVCAEPDQGTRTEMIQTWVQTFTKVRKEMPCRNCFCQLRWTGVTPSSCMYFFVLMLVTFLM